jgi:Ca2+-dependent lipid-binding protein
MIQAMGINEKDAIMARLDEIPSWVHFPDKERAEWLNKMIKILWPQIKVYASAMILSTVEPMINQYSPSFIGKLKFKQLDLGDLPPRVGSVKVYTENVSNQEVMLDVEVLYAGDAHIKLECQGMLAGLKEIQFQGDVRVILKPLCDRIPFFASITCFLLKSPHIDFNLTEVANTFDMPGLRKLIDTLLNDTISKILVLPNRLCIPIITDLQQENLNSFKSVQPRGVFRIHVIKGVNLKDADVGFMGKSDPYVKISGVGSTLKTKIINNTLNPVWNETFNIMIDELNPDPQIQLEVFDKDDTFDDDFIGGFKIDVDSIMKKSKEEGLYKLKNVKHGELNLKLEWFYLSIDKNNLELIRKVNSNNHHESTCLLLMDLKCATDLPAIKQKSNGGLHDPSPRAYFTLNDSKLVTSATQQRTVNPKWFENHYWFIDNPEQELLQVKIKDEKSDAIIATCDLPLSLLLNSSELTMDRGFDLTCLKMMSEYSAKNLHET